MKLTTAKMPKMLGDLSHTNQFLKVFAFFSVGALCMALAVIFSLTHKEPVVLALSPEGVKLESAAMPKPEDEVRLVIEKYLERRYKWEPGSVKQKLLESEAFILPESRKAFQSALAEVVRFSTEKLVSQRVYPEKIAVSLEKKSAFITGDRISVIQGLKAAGNLRLELNFESGPRTQENPSGVYITKEREEL